MAHQGAVAAPVFRTPVYAYQQTVKQPGLLEPGQVINVNAIVVTVERYLSQGGFAHVYVVQSQAPINGTRQHVLKRMAVPDESTLREVKKEVDVMKLLRGHPNIVNFIEASSRPMGNGAHEVFILMEFCPGGGIIDMMNRRLRERLTESEILTIFLNVCEGLACMHNLKPPLLHRDLKVENILQASATSYKLCDFGSATPAATRAPSTALELKALEHDLNRHTTLQYRAPEMVDVYLRRPVDEKSDIWALGVLLYKLCYYTTPFEEHGLLAILSVSYKTPPYPVYSTQMNGLIASMLREHGAQRPSVFDLLDAVHKMRGTQSKFHYNRAPSVSPLPPGSQDMSSLLLTRQRLGVSSVAGPDTRQEQLSQLAPSRRGRPSQGQTLIPSPMSLSPVKSGPSKMAEAPQRFAPVRMEITRLSDQAPQKVTSPPTSSLSPEWSPPGSSSASTSTPATGPVNGRRSPGKIGNKFDSVSISSTLGTGDVGPLLSSLDDVPPSSRIPALPSRNRATPPARLKPHHRTGPTLNTMNKPRDAFENLNSAFPAKPPPMTLGSQILVNASAAAAVGTGTNAGGLDVPSAGIGLRSPSAPYASSSHQAAMNRQQQQQPLGSPRLPPRPPRENTLVSTEAPVDERFPSIEEVERRFTPQPAPTYTSSHGRDRETHPASSTSAGSLQPPIANARQPSPSPNTSQLRSKSPSRNVYRPLPSFYTPSGSSSSQHSTPQLHPQGPRARSPPVPSKDVSISTGSSEIISLSEAGERLSSQLAPVNASKPPTASSQVPSLPPRPSQSSSGPGVTPTPTPTTVSRFTAVNGISSVGGLQLPDISAARPPAKRSPTNSSTLSDASTSSTTSMSGAPLSRRRSMQARSSYIRAPSSPGAAKSPATSVVAAAAAKTTPQPDPPQKPRDWLTGEDDLISELGLVDAATTALASPAAATTPKHERRSSRILSSPRKEAREGAIPSAIPPGPSSSLAFTGGGSAQSPKKSVPASSVGVPSTPARSMGTSLRVLPTRPETSLGTESSGGEDGAEEAASNTNFVRRKSFIPAPPSLFSSANRVLSSQHQQVFMNPTSPIATGGKDPLTLREEAGRKPYLKKPPLTHQGSGTDREANNSWAAENSFGRKPSKRQSVQDVVNAMRASGASVGSGDTHSLLPSESSRRTPRKHSSAQNLGSLDDRDSHPPLSPVRNATGAAAARRKAKGGDTSHLRAGSINTTFTAAVVNSMMGLSPSPVSTNPPNGATAGSGAGAGPGGRKPIQGGPRARPQSLFLPSPSSETYLRLPSAEPSPNSEVNSPSSTNAENTSRPRRLSISDMVHKFEAMNTEGGAGHRVPSGTGMHVHPKLTGSGAGSKPPTAVMATSTTETGMKAGKVALRGSGRSPVSPVEPVFGLGSQHITSSGTGATFSSNTPAATSFSPHQRQPRAPGPTQLPRPESPAQASSNQGASGAAAETNQPTRRMGLNIVPPTDFMGPTSSSSELISAAAISPRASVPLHSAVPERPYQGVGKLIAEWHKKSEANNISSPASKVSRSAGLR